MIEDQLHVSSGAYGALEYDQAILYGSAYITDFPLSRETATCDAAISLFGSLFSAVSSQKHRLQVCISDRVRAFMLVATRASTFSSLMNEYSSICPLMLILVVADGIFRNIH